MALQTTNPDTRWGMTETFSSRIDPIDWRQAELLIAWGACAFVWIRSQIVEGFCYC